MRVVSSADETENPCRHIYKNYINTSRYCLTSHHIGTFDTGKVNMALSRSGHSFVKLRA